jgi:hypothetical protein
LTTHPHPAQWLRILLFLICSAVLHVWLFEWDRYQIIIGPKAQIMSLADTLLLFWLLIAQSLVWFLPLFPVLGLLITFDFRRTAAVILNLFWIVFYYFMAADLVSVGFAGFHAADYLPHIHDILESPGQKIWQWAGGGLTTEAVLLLAVFVVSGPICFLCASFVTRRIAEGLTRSPSTGALVTLTAGFIFLTLAVIPSLALFRDLSVLDRVYSTMALPVSLKEPLQRFSDQSAIQLETTHAGSVAATLSVINSSALRLAQRPLISDYDFLSNRDRSDWITSDSSETLTEMPLFSLTGRLDTPFLPRVGPLQRCFPIHFNVGQFHTSLGIDVEDRGRLFSNRTGLDRLEDQNAIVPRETEREVREVLQASVDPLPADSSAFVKRAGLPNVVMIIFESFRHFAIGPDLMKRLDTWADQGLRLERHYSGSNCSHLGLFSILYGRSPLGFHQTLNYPSTNARISEIVRI